MGGAKELNASRELSDFNSNVWERHCPIERREASYGFMG